MNKTVIIVAMVLFAGCSSVGRIGVIGTHDIYRVTTWDMVAPATTTIMTHNTTDGALTKIEGGTGPSVMGQFLGPAAVATAGIYIGKGLEKSGDDTNITSSNTSESRAGAMSASAASGIGPAAAGNSWIGIGYP